MEKNKLAQLLGYLEYDPQNAALLGDATHAAIAENQLDLAIELVARLEKLQPVVPALRNVLGLCALRNENIETAAEQFRILVNDDTSNPAARFNLAWSLAKLGNFQNAETLLDDITTTALPQGAALKVQLLHQRGAFEAAMEAGVALLSLHSDHPGLNAAMSVLALDCEDTELAKQCAERATEHPDGLSSLATIELRDMEVDQASIHFDTALAINAHNPRAWVGSGLVALLRNDHADASARIDKGAEQFGDHIGSWIASGWAHLLARQYVAAKDRFERALAIDENFAESHGSLAILALAMGEIDESRRFADVARRLDRNCFSAALAHSLLAESAGNSDVARTILDRALNTPLDEEGRTIAHALVQLGL